MRRSMLALSLVLLLAGSSAEAGVAKGGGPTTLVAAFGSLWVGAGDGTITRIGERSGRVERVLRLGRYRFVYSLAAGYGSLWVATGERRLTRIDPATGRVQKEIWRIPGSWTASQVVLGAGAVWVGDFERDTVFRVSPHTDQIEAAIRLRGRLWGLAAGPAGVWVMEVPGRRVQTPALDRRLYRIDPRSNRLRGGRITLTCDSRLAVGFRAAWLLDTCSGAVTRVEPTSMRPSGLAIGTGKTSPHTMPTAYGITAAAGAVWVGRHDSAARIDPAAGRTVAAVPVSTFFIAVGPRWVWLLDPLGWVRRVDPVTNRVVGRPVCVPAPDSHC